MNIFYHFWKIWLWIDKSQNTKCEEYPIEISTRDIIKTNKDIAERLITDDVEISYSKLTYIIDQYDRVVRDMLCEGYSVKTNNITFSPRILGKWDNECINFTPDTHKLSIDCTLNPEMNNLLNSIGIKVQGFKDPSCYISKIVNSKDEGQDSIINIAQNDEITIEGQGIKAIDKDGTTSSCVLLIDRNNVIFDIGKEISVNEPDKIILRIPKSIEKGKYKLLIQTFYSPKTIGKSVYARCIEYGKTVIVK